MKKCQEWWLLFEFILHGKLGKCLKNFRSFGIVQHIGKNSKWKEVENDSKYSIANNFFMESKNVNPNGCNVVINNIHLISRDSITTHKLAQTKTPHNFWFIDPNRMIQSFHVDINLKNQFQIFIFFKSVF